MLNGAVDIGRVGQYLRAGAGLRDALVSPRRDLRFLGQLRRGFVPLPFDHRGEPVDPLPPLSERDLPALDGRRVALIGTGGSGALASIIGVARVLEEAGVTPSALAVCSGSALFGIPLAAGMPSGQVAEEVLRLSPRDLVDPDWLALATLPLRLGRGWAGLLRGDAVERAYRRMLGDVTLGELAIPVWFPMWNIEHNRLMYVGSATHPDLPAARAVRMAVALPVAMQPVRFETGWWLDGGIVDILPVQPFLEPAQPCHEHDLCDLAVVVNGFYAEGFEPDQDPRWRESTASLLHVAGQTRLMHHVQLTRRGIADLRRAVPDVIVLTPVDHDLVQGGGLYGEFLDSRRWPQYMLDGYRAAADALDAWRPVQASRSSTDQVVTTRPGSTPHSVARAAP